jgi:hypothetical protein
MELPLVSQFLFFPPLIQGRMPLPGNRERKPEFMKIVARILLAGPILLPLPLSAQTQPQPAQAPQAQSQPSQPAAAAEPAPAQQTQGTPKVKEILLRPGTIPGVAPEHQEAARKSREAREKIALCQKEASEQKILPRYRLQYVLDCIDKKTN